MKVFLRLFRQQHAKRDTAFLRGAGPAVMQRPQSVGELRAAQIDQLNKRTRDAHETLVKHAGQLEDMESVYKCSVTTAKKRQ